MELKLPDYSYQPLKSLTVCGMIGIEDADVPKEEIVLETKIEDFGNPLWLRLILNSQTEPAGIHLHIDTCLESRFSQERIPTANASRDDIYKALEDFKGCTITACSRVAFTISSDELPKDGAISLLAQVMLGSPEDEIRLSGGTFAVKKGPVDSIQWKFNEEKNQLTIRVRSSFERPLDSEYLVKCYAPLSRAFRSLVLEQEND